MQWRIGCSGFSYKDWKGNFYPEKLAQNKWFGYYTERFNTLEVNVTFYRFPRLKTMEDWYNKSPVNFLFAVKAPRLITHYKRFKDCERLLSDFYTTIKDGLRQKLGPVLFQLPPQIAYDKDFLQRMINSLDSAVDNVIEFRHGSWWRKNVYNALAKHDITFCGMNYPGLPNDVVINLSRVYYRFHGAPKLYYSQYDDNTIKSMADAVLKSRKAKDVFVYFNNTATMAAINNAAQIKQYLRLAD